MGRIKCYELADGQLRQGIALAEPDGRIVVGEVGRGREQRRVAPPSEAEILPRDGHEPARLMACSVSDREAAAVILIRDHSGFRGSWRLAAFAERQCSHEGQSFGLYNDCPECGGRCGHQLMPAAPIPAEAIGRVVARGYAAQGEAGRMGGGEELLVLAHPGRWSVRRSGRLYGRPAVLNVTVDPDGHVEVLDAEARVADGAASAAW